MPKTKTATPPETNGQGDIVKKQMAALEEGGFNLKELLDAMGLQAVAKGTEAKRESRKARAESAMTIEPLSQADQELLLEFANAAFDQSIQIDPEKGLTQSQVDDLIATLAMVRPVQDLAKGRHDGIRELFFEHFDVVNGPMTTGKAMSLAHGWKVERAIREPKAFANFEGLKDVVDEKTWKAISRQTRVVDPEKVAEAFDKGLITKEQMEQVISVGEPTQVFYVKPLRKGEEVDA